MNAETEEISQPAGTDAGRAASLPRQRKRIAGRRRARSGLALRLGWMSGWGRILAVSVGLAVLILLAVGVWKTKSMLLNNPDFLLVSDRNIQVVGNHIVPTAEVLALFAPDLGHSLFHVPMAKRQEELEQIQWVREATVMRLWPNRLRIRIVERTPVAFALDGTKVRVVDSQGVLLDLPQDVARQYTFPVLRGISSSDSPQERAAQMARYDQFIEALNAGGEDISARLSEVDLSDPEDLRAVFVGKPPQPVVHFGDSLFLARYRAYQSHLAEWAARYPHLRSVDMRYGKQVVLDTGTEDQSSSSAPQAATSAGASNSSRKPARGKRPLPAPKASLGISARGPWPGRHPVAGRHSIGTSMGIGELSYSGE